MNYVATDTELQAALDAPLNGFQKALHEAATHLPPLGVVKNTESLYASIWDHVEGLINGALNEVPNHRTPAEALPFVQDQLRKFFGKP